MSFGTWIYKNLIKPVLFLFPPDLVHNFFISFGENMGQKNFTRNFFANIFSPQTTKLNNKKVIHNGIQKEILGVKFSNPTGLSAGFDYNGRLLKILPSIGFGFSTVGTVTRLPSLGNLGPHYIRLPKSKSILVNKGFASDGAEVVAKRLSDPDLQNITFGVSIGSSNLPEINTIDLAIEDYIETFKIIEKTPYHKYYELNISCPNTCLTENFLIPKNFEKLLAQIKHLKLKRPIFIKMPNEGILSDLESLVEISMKFNITAFIFSNLKKDRDTSNIDPQEYQLIKNLPGNLSGLPTKSNSNFWIEYFRKKYQRKIVIIGVGGIFSPQDAIDKINAGADLVQLITGLVYEGPFLVPEINSKIQKLYK